MFKLPDFSFSNAKLLSTETVEYHHGKHHRAYIENLNRLTKNMPQKDILEIISNSEGAIYDQYKNYTFRLLCHVY